jgi:hypothetical protein
MSNFGASVTKLADMMEQTLFRNKAIGINKKMLFLFGTHFNINYE